MLAAGGKISAPTDNWWFIMGRSLLALACFTYWKKELSPAARRCQVPPSSSGAAIWRGAIPTLRFPQLVVNKQSYVLKGMALVV